MRERKAISKIRIKREREMERERELITNKIEKKLVETIATENKKQLREREGERDCELMTVMFKMFGVSLK